MPRIVCISDTHQRHDGLNVPEGDVLIHAGDFTNEGHRFELERFAEWFRAFPHRLKIVVPGNHDFCFDEKHSDTDRRVRSIITLIGFPGDPANVEFLNDRAIERDGLKIYGTPWVPTFNDWAFMLPQEQLREKFDKIPSGLDILVTHGPAYGIMDHSKHFSSPAGSTALHEAILRTQPRLHVCGHIHEGYGIKEVDGIVRVNACSIAYEKYNEPIVVEL